MAIRRKAEAETQEAAEAVQAEVNSDERLRVVAELYSAALKLPTSDEAVLSRAKRFLKVMGLD